MLHDACEIEENRNTLDNGRARQVACRRGGRRYANHASRGHKRVARLAAVVLTNLDDVQGQFSPTAAQMEVLESRIHSFTKAKPSSKVLSWPHPDSFLATAETLADAGFYYNPSKDDPDNVACFQCGKELGGWDDDDDPFEIHSKKCPKCPWVLVRCNPKLDNEGEGAE